VAQAVDGSLGTSASAAGNCLDEISLARLMDGAASAAERSAGVFHLSTCGHCRREFAGLITLLADAGVGVEVRALGQGVDRASARRQVFTMAGVAAAVIMFAIAFPRMPPPTPLEHRGPTLTAAEAPAAIMPTGDVTAASRLEWSAVAGADRYRVTVFSATGQVLLETETTDTVAQVPDSITFAPGQSYLWKVEARTGWDRWTTSELTEFRLDPAPDSITSAIPEPDSLQVLARRLLDSALVRVVRARPLDIRPALGAVFAAAVRGEPVARAEQLSTARRLAAAYAAAWGDEFLVREVARFSAWPPASAAAKVRADSLRRVGVSVYSRDGAAAAIAVWRRSLTGSASIGDTAGMAATLGNIGAGLSHVGQPDSAQRYLDRSRALAAAVGDLRVEANALSELAGVVQERNDLATASQYYGRAIELRTRIGDSRGLASDYNNLAGLARAAGDFAESRRQLEAALILNQREGRADVAATNLVNLASLAILSGDFTRAESLYVGALRTWRGAQEWADVADAEHGLGALEVRRGDYPAARAHLVQARALYDRTGPPASALLVRQELAGVRAAEGDLQKALDELGAADRLADSTGLGPSERAGVVLARADLAAQLNDRAEAERLYVNAGQLYKRAEVRSGEAEALRGQGILALSQDEYPRAKDLLQAALQAELAAGDRRSAALTRLWIGEGSIRSGDSSGARAQFAHGAAELARLGDPVGMAAALGERASLEAAAGFPAAADSLYRAALRAVGNRVAPAVTWQLHAGLASVRRDQGASNAAAWEFRAAIRDIELAGRSLVLPERRSSYLTDKWSVYIESAMLERSRGNLGAAFDASESLRAGEMLDMLAQGRVSAQSDTAAELVMREQDLRRHIAELTRGLEIAPAGAQLLRGPDVSRGGVVTREALMRAQTSYGELLLEMRERAPRQAALVSRETAPWREVSTRLAPDEAFIEYLVSDEGSIAFVVTHDTLAALPLGANRRDLARLVDFARATLPPRGSPRLDSLWRAPLTQLNQDLIAPIESAGLLAGKRRLIIAPHAELHYLPFAALLAGQGQGRFLIERYQVIVTPSASVWLALGARPSARATGGVLAMAPRPDVLPASHAEVAAIAGLGGGDTRILVGSAATEAAFRREAPNRRVIHLATYGVLNKQNPLFSFVELAPDLGDDGELEVHEVFGLHLAADLVVLSACQTGLGSGALSDMPAGDDWIGLARAFLSAGAGRVIATLWPVQDQASAALMERFYQRYALDPDPERALAMAQRALLANPATASPYYWAGFEVVGGR